MWEIRGATVNRTIVYYYTSHIEVAFNSGALGLWQHTEQPGYYRVCLGKWIKTNVTNQFRIGSSKGFNIMTLWPTKSGY